MKENRSRNGNIQQYNDTITRVLFSKVIMKETDFLINNTYLNIQDI